MIINWAYKKYKAKKAAKEEEKRAAAGAASNPTTEPAAGQNAETSSQSEQPKQ